MSCGFLDSNTPVEKRSHRSERPLRIRARGVRRVARWRRRLRLCRRSAARSSPRSMSRPPVPWTRHVRSPPRRARPSRPRTSRRPESAPGRLARARGPAPRETRRSAPSRRPRRPPRERRTPREASVCSPGASRTTARHLASRESSPNREPKSPRSARRRPPPPPATPRRSSATPPRRTRARPCAPPRARLISTQTRDTRRRSTPKQKGSGASERRRATRFSRFSPAKPRRRVCGARRAPRLRRGEARLLFLAFPRTTTRASPKREPRVSRSARGGSWRTRTERAPSLTCCAAAWRRRSPRAPSRRREGRFRSRDSARKTILSRASQGARD